MLDREDSKAPSAPTPEAPSETNQRPDYRAPSGYRVKRLARLRAEAELCGIGLHRAADGSYTVSRWGFVREFQTLDDAAQFLAQMGVAT